MLIPVIHVENYSQTRRNIETCLSLGIDHVFLIRHGGWKPVDDLVEVFDLTKEEFPSLWIGLNFLQIPNLEAVKICNDLKADAIWCDNAHLLRAGETAEAEEFMKVKSENVKYFGGIEFKYQHQPHLEDLKWVYDAGKKYTDVITTSGPGTGKEISIAKLERSRELAGDHLLAVASGVNLQNKKLLDQYANILMVASSITDKGEIINYDKLKALSEI